MALILILIMQDMRWILELLQLAANEIHSQRVCSLSLKARFPSSISPQLTSILESTIVQSVICTPILPLHLISLHVAFSLQHRIMRRFTVPVLSMEASLRRTQNPRLTASSYSSAIRASAKASSHHGDAHIKVGSALETRGSKRSGSASSDK